jgi:glycine reductase
MEKVRVMHYLNQFFAGVGGEEKGDVPVNSCEGPLGPGKPLQTLFGDIAEIVVTAYCGDNYFPARREDALNSILQIARNYDIRILVAGPAFQAGRYGFACIEVCHFLSTSLGLSCVTGMHVENPAVEGYKQYKDRRVFALPTGESTRGKGMEDALSSIAKFVSKLTTDSSIGSASEEGYIPRGIRVTEFVNKCGAERATDMLLEKLAGRSYATEIPIESFEAIPVPAKIANLSRVQLALGNTAGANPVGNPDRFTVGKNTRWGKYRIDNFDSMKDGKWDFIHSGFNTSFMYENPNYGAPLDVCKEMERERMFKLYPYLYSTSGGGGMVLDMQSIGKGIARDMKAEGVGAVLMVST